MRTFRKALAMVLAIAMVLTTFGTVFVSAASYSDTEGHWGEAYIDEWTGYGVIQGYEDGTFGPDDAITRAEVAQVTQNVISFVDTAENTFTDVSTSDWYADAVLKLVAAGALVGNGDGTMTPNNYMTREEAMTMLARAYGLTVENSNAAITMYSDYENVSDYATGYVGSMTSHGYVNGYEDGSLRPKDLVSRAEFIKMLDNMIGLYITEPGTYGPEYVSGIVMIKCGDVTLSGIVTDGVVVSPQVSGSVTITGSQVSGNVVNLSPNVNLSTNSGTIISPYATDSPSSSTIYSIYSGTSGGSSSSGSSSHRATSTPKPSATAKPTATPTANPDATATVAPVAELDVTEVPFDSTSGGTISTTITLQEGDSVTVITNFTTGEVLVEGVDYAIDENGVITFTEEFLNSLYDGEHVIQIMTKDSTEENAPTITITVTGSTVPTATPTVEEPTATPVQTDVPTDAPVTYYTATLNVNGGDGVLKNAEGVEYEKISADPTEAPTDEPTSAPTDEPTTAPTDSGEVVYSAETFSAVGYAGSTDAGASVYSGTAFDLVAAWPGLTVDASGKGVKNNGGGNLEVTDTAVSENKSGRGVFVYTAKASGTVTVTWPSLGSDKSGYVAVATADDTAVSSTSVATGYSISKLKLVKNSGSESAEASLTYEVEAGQTYMIGGCGTDAVISTVAYAPSATSADVSGVQYLIPAGDVVTIETTATVSGSEVSISVDGAAIEGNTFTMPEKDVTVDVTYSEVSVPTATPTAEPTRSPDPNYNAVVYAVTDADSVNQGESMVVSFYVDRDVFMNTASAIVYKYDTDLFDVTYSSANTSVTMNTVSGELRFVFMGPVTYTQNELIGTITLTPKSDTADGTYDFTGTVLDIADSQYLYMDNTLAESFTVVVGSGITPEPTATATAEPTATATAEPTATATAEPTATPTTEPEPGEATATPAAYTVTVNSTDASVALKNAEGTEYEKVSDEEETNGEKFNAAALDASYSAAANETVYAGTTYTLIAGWNGVIMGTDSETGEVYGVKGNSSSGNLTATDGSGKMRGVLVMTPTVDGTVTVTWPTLASNKSGVIAVATADDTAQSSQPMYTYYSVSALSKVTGLDGPTSLSYEVTAGQTYMIGGDGTDAPISSVVLTPADASAAATSTVKYTVPAGDVVTVDVTPDTADATVTISVDGVALTGTSFTMPENDVTVDVVATAASEPTATPVYYIATVTTTNGTSKLTNASGIEFEKVDTTNPTATPTAEPVAEATATPTAEPVAEATATPTTAPVVGATETFNATSYSGGTDAGTAVYSGTAFSLTAAWYGIVADGNGIKNVSNCGNLVATDSTNSGRGVFIYTAAADGTVTVTWPKLGSNKSGFMALATADDTAMSSANILTGYSISVMSTSKNEGTETASVTLSYDVEAGKTYMIGGCGTDAYISSVEFAAAATAALASEVAYTADLPADVAWTAADSDLNAIVLAAANDGDAFEYSMTGAPTLYGYGAWSQNGSQLSYTHTNGVTYTFSNKGWQAGSGGTTKRCFYFTPEQACIVTVAYTAQAGRPMYIYQGSTLLASGEEGANGTSPATIEADIEDPTAGDIYIYGGSSNKQLYGIFVDYYDPTVVTYRTLSGNVSYVGNETGYSLRFTDTTDGTVYMASIESGAYSVDLRQNRTYDIAVLDATNAVSTTMAATLDTNSISIYKQDLTYDVTLVDIALTEVTGEVVVSDIFNDGTSLDLSGVELTFTCACADSAHTYTTTIENNAIAVTMMPNETYTVTATGIDGYELSELSSTYTMAAGDTAPFKNILIQEVLDSYSFKDTLEVGSDKEFATINDAITAITKMTDRPSGEDGRVTIVIDPGTYTEQVIVSPSYVTLKGADDSNRPEIQWYYGIGYLYYSANGGYYSEDYAVAKTEKGPVTRWGAACRITGSYVYLESINFTNTFNCFVSDAELADGVEAAQNNEYSDTNGKPDRTVSGYDAMSRNATERAAAIALDGDYMEAYKCDFVSSQDTFYTKGHIYVKDCYIEGGTDYIYGGSSVIFDDCTLAWHGYSDQSTGGYLTACSDGGSNGYLVRNATVTTSKYYPTNQFAAGGWGRNWGGASCHVIYSGMTFDGIDYPTSWTKMGGELSLSVLYIENVTDKNGNAVDVSGTGFNPNGTMEDNGYTIASDSEYFGGSWNPPHYESSEVQTSVVTTWLFGQSNGAATYTLEGEGATAEIPSSSTTGDTTLYLTVDATAGKFNNDRGDEWAQVNQGTTITVPVSTGSEITFVGYSTEEITAEDGTAFVSGETYTYMGEATTLTLTVSVGGYFSGIAVESPILESSTVQYLIPADEVVYVTAESSIDGLTPSVVVTGADYDATTMTFTMPESNVDVDITFVDGSETEPTATPTSEPVVEPTATPTAEPSAYSEWLVGQLNADGTDGDISVVDDYEGQTALLIASRNAYTVLDDAVSSGYVVFDMDMYVPDTTSNLFRVYFENANESNYQDSSNANSGVIAEAVNVAAGNIYAGPDLNPTTNVAGTYSTTGWYHFIFTLDYDAVGTDSFITINVTDPDDNVVVDDYTIGSISGIDTTLSQIRIVGRAANQYFANMSVTTGDSPVVSTSIDYELPFAANGTSGTSTTIDNVEISTTGDYVLFDGNVTLTSMQYSNTHGAQGNGPITVVVPGSVDITLGTCAYDDVKIVVTDASGATVAEADDVVGTQQALASESGNGTYNCYGYENGSVTLNYTGDATTLTISFESSTNGASSSARWWLPYLRITSVEEAEPTATPTSEPVSDPTATPKSEPSAYSEWLEGQVNADGTDGDISVVDDYEGQTALLITSRNAYTVLDETVSSGYVVFDMDMYVPDATSNLFRVYFENANESNYQDSSNANSGVIAEAVNVAAGNIYAGPDLNPTTNVAGTYSTTGWYHFIFTLDYNAVGTDSFITIHVTDPNDNVVVDDYTIGSISGIDTTLSQIRIVGRAADQYFANMSVTTFDSPVVSDPTPIPTATPEAVTVIYHGNTTDITGGNQCNNTATYVFVDGVDDDVVALLADETDSTIIDSTIIANYLNYVGGTGNSASNPIIAVDLEPGTYTLYYVGYNNESEFTATDDNYVVYTVNDGSGTQLAYDQDNTSRVLKYYTMDLDFTEGYTGNLTFDTTAQWLPDLYAIIIDGTKSGGSVEPSEPTATPTAEPVADPTATPTAEPVTDPTATPTTEPVADPTATPTAEPTTAYTATLTVTGGTAELLDADADAYPTVAPETTTETYETATTETTSYAAGDPIYTGTTFSLKAAWYGATADTYGIKNVSGCGNLTATDSSNSGRGVAILTAETDGTVTVTWPSLASTKSGFVALATVDATATSSAELLTGYAISEMTKVTGLDGVTTLSYDVEAGNTYMIGGCGTDAYISSVAMTYAVGGNVQYTIPAGDEITVSTTAATTGYEAVITVDGVALTGSTFTMPEKNVAVDVTFVEVETYETATTETTSYAAGDPIYTGTTFSLKAAWYGATADTYGIKNVSGCGNLTATDSNNSGRGVAILTAETDGTVTVTWPSLASTKSGFVALATVDATAKSSAELLTGYAISEMTKVTGLDGVTTLSYDVEAGNTYMIGGCGTDAYISSVSFLARQ